MNIEKWIEGCVVSGVDNEELVITLSDLQSLLETHAIVPREPSVEMILATSNDFTGSQQEVIKAYKAMIKAEEKK